MGWVLQGFMRRRAEAAVNAGRMWRRWVGDGGVESALRMCESGMRMRNEVLFWVLEECVRRKDYVGGRRVQDVLVRRRLDAHVLFGKKLIRLFASCGYLSEAYHAFRSIGEPKVATWRAIISAHTDQGENDVAVKLYREMVQSGLQGNGYIYVPVLQACAKMGALKEGRDVHADMVRGGGGLSDVHVASSLVDMYCKCGSLEEARDVFEEVVFGMKKKNVVVWTAMICGYARHGHGEEAVAVFEEMRVQGVEANRVTLVCMLKACGSIAALELGREIHGELVSKGWEKEVVVGNRLVDMYGRCGSLDEAWDVLKHMRHRDVVSWNVIIGGLAHNGRADEAMAAFEQMQEEGVKPGKVTFVSILGACRHSGRMEDGCRLFQSMSSDFGIWPGLEHYACMVDLLGRAGHLDEAQQLIDNMPMAPDVKVWTSMLAACHQHTHAANNLRLASRCFHHIVKLQPSCASAYVLMSHIYAAAGRTEDATEVRNQMILAGVKKVPGRSWLPIHNQVHSFQSQDVNHPQWKHICACLDNLKLAAARPTSSLSNPLHKYLC